MELRIITPEESFLKAIDFNHEELKQELALRLEKYKGLTYTEDEIKNAKEDRATLNKFKTALEDKRKEIKKICLTPYETFESRIKEIVAMVETPIVEIDKQVKSYETAVKEDKKLVIEGMYAENIGDLKELLPLQKIWSEKWLNAGEKLPKILEEIVNTIEKVKNDLVTIKELQTEFETQVTDKYLLTLDLSTALKENARLKEQKEKLEVRDKENREQKLKETQEKLKQGREREEKAKERAKAIEIELEKPIEAPKSEEVILTGKMVGVPIEIPTLEQLDFRVWVTPEQKQLLKQFLIENSIKYGKVE